MTSSYCSRASGLLASLTVISIKDQSFLFFCSYSKAISSLKTIFLFLQRMILLLLMFLVLLEANMTYSDVQIEVYHCTCSACHLEDLKYWFITNLMPCNTQKVSRYSCCYLIHKRNENSVMPWKTQGVSIVCMLGWPLYFHILVVLSGAVWPLFDELWTSKQAAVTSAQRQFAYSPGSDTRSCYIWYVFLITAESLHHHKSDQCSLESMS